MNQYGRSYTDFEGRSILKEEGDTLRMGQQQQSQRIYLENASNVATEIHSKRAESQKIYIENENWNVRGARE
jgi:hypothetical protein